MTLNEFLSSIDTSKPLLLSLDLDDTIVIRSKGDNYVSPGTKDVIEKLIKLNNVHLLINTGRDYIGTQAFQMNGCNIKDALMMSGAISMINNEIYGFKNAYIEKSIFNFFSNLVLNGELPFIDCTGCGERCIFFNENANQELFFSQNPRTRFETLPKILNIKDLGNHLSSNYFRIEFPVSYENNLFHILTNKNPNALQEFNNLFNASISEQEYRLNKKNSFGSEIIKSQRCFGRIERSRDYCNKGIGIKNWIELQNNSIDQRNIVHIGDQDEGVINDTLVKKYIDTSKVVMVGDKCKKNNSLVSLYLEGDIEGTVLNLLKSFYDLYV